MKMGMDFRELTEEEIETILPDLAADAGEDVMAYGAMTPEGEFLCSAVFLPSAYRKDEAVLCSLDIRPETKKEIRLRFFRTCVTKLRNKMEFNSIYYRSTGSKKEMKNRYDLLVSLGFRPTVLSGRRFSFTVKELCKTRFAKDFTPPEKGDPRLFRLDQMSDPEALGFLKKHRMSDHCLKNRSYSPEYSFLYLKTPENGGILCANASEDLLFVTDLILDYELEKVATEIFYRLLGALIAEVSKTFPSEGRIIFFFDQDFCNEKLKKMLPEGEELFQEFLFQ